MKRDTDKIELREDKLGISWVSQLSAERKKFEALMADARKLRQMIYCPYPGQLAEAIAEFDARWGKP